MVFLFKFLPVCATLLHRVEVAIALQDLIFCLNKLHTKTRRNVERNVAVHLECQVSTELSETFACETYQPYTWVV